MSYKLAQEIDFIYAEQSERKSQKESNEPGHYVNN